jgi:hypothetical protein
MFKQMKSAFIWYHIFKFRKTVILIVLLLSVVLFSQWIYSDVVEYLTLRKKLEYLDILLPLKWGIIFFNIGLSAYLIILLFRKEKKQEEKVQDNTRQTKQKEKEIKKEVSSSLNQREASFLHKKKLNNKADKLTKR